MTRRDALKRTALLGAAASITPSLLAQSGRNAGLSVVQAELPYAFDALEPAIDARTMEIHYSRHHAGYTRKFNAALEQLTGFSSPTEVLSSLPDVPEALRTAVRNNGGGYWNHTLFWNVMADPHQGGGGEPAGDLLKRINRDFGSFEAFQKQFSQAAATQFGSGWAWLILRSSDGRLAVTHTPNQDNPLMKGVVPDNETGTPLLGLDVWEHAYYLNYQNRRGDYISNWWKLVNWSEAADSLG
jgi:Fe-Mn family superoxide dismutase